MPLENGTESSPAQLAVVTGPDDYVFARIVPRFQSANNYWS
jgi:hypothetical protein